MGTQNAKMDLERYRKGYPGEEDDPQENDNQRFYRNEMRSYPDGDFIDEIHKNWWGQYGKLERHHGYIQWLFPIRENGMNIRSQKLQPHEIEAIKTDHECAARLVRSYELMLDFYGIVLQNRETGELQRSENWKSRYENLNFSGHNYLRITRILKCLGELGFEHYKPRFIEFFIEEIFVHRQLRNCKGSLANYWVGTIKDDAERARLEGIIEEPMQGPRDEIKKQNKGSESQIDDVEEDQDVDQAKAKQSSTSISDNTTATEIPQVNQMRFGQADGGNQQAIKKEGQVRKKEDEKDETEQGDQESQMS